MSLSSRKKMRQ